jgi:hypothetical protein
MKIKFKKTVSVDYFSFRLQEWIDQSFERNEIVEIKRLENTISKWSDLLFDNGDVAADVHNETFDLC